MPEIRNEIPSDQELAEYLEDCLNSSSLPLLNGRPALRSHYHPDLVEAITYLSSQPISSQFLLDLRQAIFCSLQRLNALPRTNSFWNNTNRRPTIFKLTEFCEKILSGEPEDVPCLLTLTAMTLFHTGEFQQGRWSQLRSLNAVSIEWVVFGAMYMHVCGAEDASDFSEYAKSSETKEELVAILDEIGRSGGALLSQWSREVLMQLAR